MCVAVPGRIVDIGGDGFERWAVVDLAGREHHVNLALLPDAAIGEWVVTHCGFAIARVGEEPAMQTMADLGKVS